MHGSGEVETASLIGGVNVALEGVTLGEREPGGSGEIKALQSRIKRKSSELRVTVGADVVGASEKGGRESSRDDQNKKLAEKRMIVAGAAMVDPILGDVLVTGVDRGLGVGESGKVVLGKGGDNEVRKRGVNDSALGGTGKSRNIKMRGAVRRSLGILEIL